MSRPKYALAMITTGVLLAACRTDKTRLLATGNKYYDQGKFLEASVIYRAALARDGRYEEAHYRLGLAEIGAGHPRLAAGAFRRSCELNPRRIEACAKLGDLMLTSYLASPVRSQEMIDEIDDVAELLIRQNAQSFEGLRLRGYIHLLAGRRQEALTAFETANRSQPNQGKLVVLLAEMLAADNRASEAEALLTDCLRADPQYGPAYDALYRLYWLQARRPEAEQVLLDKVARVPASTDWWLQLASHYLRVGRRDEMQRTVERMTAQTRLPIRFLKAGDFWFGLGDLNRAIDSYQRGLEEDPRRAVEYQKKMVECLYAAGLSGKALGLAEELVQKYPDDPECLGLKALLQLRMGGLQNIDAAVTGLRTAVRHQAASGPLHFRLGEALVLVREYDEAARHLEKAIELRPQLYAARIALGELHLTRRDFGKALRVAEEVLQVLPQDLSALMVRASAWIGQGETAKARRDLAEVLAVRKDLPRAVLAMASLDLSEKRFREAEGAYRRVYDADPRDASALQGLVETLFVAGRAKEARALVDGEVKRFPDSFPHRMVLAELAAREQRYDAAIEELRYLLSKVPLSPELHYRLGEIYRRAGKHEQAAAAFEDAVKANPDYAEAHMQRAMVYMGLERREQAIQAYREAIRLMPENPAARNNLAYLLALDRRNLDEALQHAQRAVQLDPSPAVYDTLGLVFLERGLIDNAIQIFGDLVRKAPKDAHYRYHLGLSLLRKGDRVKARQELQAALAQGPSPDEQRRIRQALARVQSN